MPAVSGLRKCRGCVCLAIFSPAQGRFVGARLIVHITEISPVLRVVNSARRWCKSRADVVVSADFEAKTRQFEFYNLHKKSGR